MQFRSRDLVPQFPHLLNEDANGTLHSAAVGVLRFCWGDPARPWHPHRERSVHPAAVGTAIVISWGQAGWWKAPGLYLGRTGHSPAQKTPHGSQEAVTSSPQPGARLGAPASTTDDCLASFVPRPGPATMGPPRAREGTRGSNITGSNITVGPDTTQDEK